MDAKVAAYKSALAATLGQAGLPYDYLAGLNGLTAKDFYAKSLSGAIMIVFTSSACFDF